MELRTERTLHNVERKHIVWDRVGVRVSQKHTPPKNLQLFLQLPPPQKNK